MSEHLDKAYTYAGYSEEHDTPASALPAIARMYAAIAQAEAAERTAQAIERIAALLECVVGAGNPSGTMAVMTCDIYNAWKDNI